MDINDSSKAISLAKKLLELANRGIGGEANNATKLLDALLAKHNLTLDDIEKPETHRCEYNIASKHQKLFFQIVYNSIENWDGKYVRGNTKRIIILYLTYAQELEITAKFDFYVQSYDKQIKLFMIAFMHKNALYAKRTKDYVDNDATSKLSIEDSMIVSNLRHGIVKTDFQNRIEDMSKLID